MNDKVLVSSERILTLDIPKPEDMKVSIWDYELCNGAEWKDFLEVINKLGEENKALKIDRDDWKKESQDLQEQLHNAIVPKFKIGQEVFIVIDKVDKAKVEKIIATISKLDDETFTFYSITDSYGYALRLPEGQIFATREDAEKRLAELKGDTK